MRPESSAPRPVPGDAIGPALAPRWKTTMDKGGIDMKVRNLMTSRVESCNPGTDLGTAAMIMWRNDCGIVPVVEEASGQVCGVVTDRDICMALALTGRRPAERTVGELMSGVVHAVSPDDNVAGVLRRMRQHRVRRLPVVGTDGKLRGMISLNDLILHAESTRLHAHVALSFDQVMETLQGVCEHRAAAAPVPQAEGELTPAG